MALNLKENHHNCIKQISQMNLYYIDINIVILQFEKKSSEIFFLCYVKNEFLWDKKKEN